MNIEDLKSSLRGLNKLNRDKKQYCLGRYQVLIITSSKQIKNIYECTLSDVLRSLQIIIETDSMFLSSPSSSIAKELLKWYIANLAGDTQSMDEFKSNVSKLRGMVSIERDGTITGNSIVTVVDKSYTPPQEDNNEGQPPTIKEKTTSKKKQTKRRTRKGGVHDNSAPKVVKPNKKTINVQNTRRTYRRRF